MEQVQDASNRPLTFVEKVNQIAEEIQARYASKEEECRTLLQRLEGNNREVNKMCNAILSLEGRIEELTGRKLDLDLKKENKPNGEKGQSLERIVKSLKVIVTDLKSEMLKLEQGADDGKGSISFLDLLKEPKVANNLLSFLTVKEMKTLSRISKAALQSVRESDANFLARVHFTLSKQLLESDVNLFNLESNNLKNWKNLTLELHPNIPPRVKSALWKGLEKVEYLKLRLYSKSTSEMGSHLSEVFGVARHLRKLELEKVTTLRGSNMAGIPFHQILGQLSPTPPQLQKFSCLEVMKAPFLQIIPAILEASKLSLEEVQLHYQLWTVEEIKTIVCPKVKRLKFVTSPEDCDTSLKHLSNLEFFLAHQPALEELDMTVSPSLACQIFKFVCRNGKFGKLKRLRLQVGSVYCSPTPPSMSLEAWRLLRKSQLKELSLSFVIHGRTNRDRADKFWWGNGKEILMMLPATLEKMELEGMDDFWARPGIKAVLSRFRSLKELHLRRCFSLGGTGTGGGAPPPPPAPSPFSCLTQLTRLEMEECAVSQEDVLRLVKSESLRALVIKYSPFMVDDKMLRRDFLFQVVKHNPSLESVKLFPFFLERKPSGIIQYMILKDMVKRLNPNVKVLELLSQTGEGWRSGN